RRAHHHRRLESLGAARVGRPFAGIVDRSSTLWWFALDASIDEPSSPLALYDARFAERVALLTATEVRNEEPSKPRPGAPWWHRECETCPFRVSCHASLAATDDVSLVRFTDGSDQTLLRSVAISTRRELAATSLAEVAFGIARGDEGRAFGCAGRDERGGATTPRGIALGRQVRDSPRLVRRARVEVCGSL